MRPDTLIDTWRVLRPFEQALELKPPRAIASRAVEPGEQPSHFNAMNLSCAIRLYEQQRRECQLRLQPRMPLKSDESTRGGLVHALGVHLDAVHHAISTPKSDRALRDSHDLEATCFAFSSPYPMGVLGSL